MHCRKDPITNNVACYVTNYGVGDQSPGNYDLAKAADTSTAGATVAMEYSPGPLGTKIVKFYVFGGGVAASPRIPFADLDGSGQKFVPQLCLTCHGGNYQPANTLAPDPAEVNMGASFREFDIYSYRDGTLGDKPNELASGIHEIVNTDPLDPPLGQQTEFLEQNKIVRATAPEPAISSLINLWYHNTDTLPFEQNAVPAGWTTDASTSNLYLKVVAKACRACHLAQPSLDASSKAWVTYAQFRTYALNNYIPSAVCYGDPSHGATGFADEKRFRYMPHANVTYKNFWLNIDAYTTLGTYTGPGWGTAINASPDHECIP
jgi:mono/diheme cytochrome c family protein